MPHSDFFSGDERKPTASDDVDVERDRERADGGPDASASERSPVPYTQQQARSFVAGFLPAFLAMLTELAPVWVGVMVAGVAIAVGVRMTDRPIGRTIIAFPLLFAGGLLAGLLVGLGFVELGIDLPVVAPT